MKLGEQIEIIGFDNLEPALLIVVKRVTGSNVRQISDKNKGFESIKIMLKESKKDSYKLDGTIVVDKKEKTVSAEGSNLFFALNALFNELQKDL